MPLGPAGAIGAARARRKPTPAADATLTACLEVALRAQHFPAPLGPPMPDFEIAEGTDARPCLVANASLTCAIVAP